MEEQYYLKSNIIPPNYAYERFLFRILGSTTNNASMPFRFDYLYQLENILLL